MNENNAFQMDVESIKAWRTWIKVAAFVVYIAGALFGTIIFSTHLSSQFPADPIFRMMAYAGAWANFLSLCVMPLAKEYWVSGRTMTAAAWLFWVLEFLMVVLNTLAAFASSWATWWTPLSPASPVFVVAIWGILWYLNPESKGHQEQVSFYTEAQSDFHKMLRRALKSKKIQDIMADGAALAAHQYTEKALGVAIDNTSQPDNKATKADLAPESQKESSFINKLSAAMRDALDKEQQPSSNGAGEAAKTSSNGTGSNPTKPSQS